MRLFSASAQAWLPKSGLFTPLMATAPLGDTWYCTACWPAMKTALPDTLVQVKVALPLALRN